MAKCTGSEVSVVRCKQRAPGACETAVHGQVGVCLAARAKEGAVL